MIKIHKRFFYFLSIICLTFLMVSPVSATSPVSSSIAATNSSLYKTPLWTQNNIDFYYPSCVSNSGSGCCSVELPEDMTNEEERQKKLFESCAEWAISMQIEYGIPWELVFAQMHHESNTGAAYIGSAVYSDNNYLGLSRSDSNLYSRGSGCASSRFDCYDTIADSMASYIVDFLRNGNYDSGLPYTSASEFSLEQYFFAIISSYCPPSDGCDAQSYWSGVSSAISFFDQLASEKGLPTSEEVARQNNLAAGGNHPELGNIKPSLGEPHSLHAECGSGSSASSSSTSSVVTWSDGWITGGLSGFQKEDAVALKGSALKDDKHEQNYTTDNGKPNKILLHYTAGTTSGLDAYGDNLYPAHFTINLKTKSTSQHFPIDKPSDATKGGDLGGAVQIEIVGYGLDANGNCNGIDDGNEYCFLNFADEDWDYLATLLAAISEWGSTNGAEIPLTTSVSWDLKSDDSQRINSTSTYTNTTGIVSHMHSPTDDHTDTGNIWDKVESAIKRYSGNDICSDSSSSGDFASYVLKYAWPEYRDSDVDKPEYKEAAQKHIDEGKYTGSAGFHSGDPGVDCGGFVTVIIQDSGVDPNYNSSNCNTSCQIAYTKANWERVSDTSQLQPGAVAFNSDDSNGGGHTWTYVGDIEGFGSNVASASWGERAPCAGGEGLTGVWYQKGSN